MAHIHIPDEVYAEFILRMGRSVDVDGWVVDIVSDYLDRTENDDSIWASESYLERLADKETEAFLAEYGSPNKGYQWQNVFLPNGSRLKMTYRGVEHIAEVKNERIIYEGNECSPSEFASRAANNTSRSAPRDLSIKFPDSNNWENAKSVMVLGRRKNA